MGRVRLAGTRDCRPDRSSIESTGSLGVLYPLIRTPDQGQSTFVSRPLGELLQIFLREKYGFRDWWIGVIFDTSQSVAVRMVPLGSVPD